MTAITTVTVLEADTTKQNDFGPAVLEHRTAQAGFEQLGNYFMTFEQDGFAEPWTLEYEETVYVVSGEAQIGVGSVGDEVVRATEGQIVALPQGTTVRYGGTAGTRLLLSMAPVRWREQATSAVEPARVLFLTPFHFGSSEHDDEFDRLAETLLNGHPDYHVVARHLEAFETADETYDADQERAVVAAVEGITTDEFDVIVIACHYDPAVEAARKATSVPVVAPFQLSAAVAEQLGPRFAVITDLLEAEDFIQGLADKYGHHDACSGVTAIGWDGDAILDDTLGAARAVDAQLEKLAAEGDVQSVVIGCTIVSAAYELHRSELPDRGLTVVNSNLASVRGATALLPR